jgi:hypothetical protein
MITIARVKQATKEFIKVLRFGRNDVITAEPVLPHGIDSKPVADTPGVHATTQNNDTTVMLGYILHSEITKEGETRIYATDENGNEVFDIFLKRDGTCEFGGNSDFIVRYNALNTGLTSFVNTLNTALVTAFATVGYTWTPITLNISSAKVNNIKTP